MGGGASSVIILDKIASTGRKVKVRVFEGSPDKPIGPGYAFDVNQSDTNLTNSPIDYVSIKGDRDEEHYLRWIRENEEKWRPSFPDLDIDKLSLYGSFLPRKLGGIYLEDSYKSLKAKLDVEEVRAEVLKVVPKGDQQHLETTKGTFISDFTILATGNIENTAYSELIGKEGYFPYHYSDETGIRRLVEAWSRPEMRILVLGTRLGAIDATIFLSHIL